MLKYNYFKEFENLILTWNHVSNKINVLAATLHGSRPGGAIRMTHYDVIDDVITRKLYEIEKNGDHLAP